MPAKYLIEAVTHGVLEALGFESLARESRDTTQPSNSVIAGSPQRLWLCFHGDSKPRTRDAAESVVAAGDDLMHREVGQLAGGRPIIGIRAWPATSVGAQSSRSPEARKPIRLPDPLTMFFRETPMPDDSEPAPRRAMPPLMDRLGELCVAGRDSATYLWQVPNDEDVRRKIAELLAQIKVEAAKQGRQEMSRLVLELETAVAASPSPQQVELLQDGFERLMRLWAAAKSGLF